MSINTYSSIQSIKSTRKLAFPTIKNGNFNNTTITTNAYYAYANVPTGSVLTFSQSTPLYYWTGVVGYASVDAIDVVNGTPAGTYPFMPISYPSGITQACFLRGNQQIYQNVIFPKGSYTFSLYACGRSELYNVADKLSVVITLVGSSSPITVIAPFSLSNTSVLTNYTGTFTITTQGLYQVAIIMSGYGNNSDVFISKVSIL